MLEAPRRALITGANGFVGPYLARYLSSQGCEVWGTSRRAPAHKDFKSIALDVRDQETTLAVIHQLRPDEIYHLAALSRPHLEDERRYYETNALGTLNVVEAAFETGARVLVTSSAYVYGNKAGAITEDTALRPTGAYGASKAAAEMACLPFAAKGLHLVRVRPFNHTGPGQGSAFFVPTLITQLAAIEDGRDEPVIRLGNLDSIRDLSDVRDVVRAYVLALREGASGEVYNVASGLGTRMSEVVDIALKLVGSEVEVVTDPERVRPSDLPELVGDPARLRSLTKWTPGFSLEDTLRDMLSAAGDDPRQ